MPKDQVNLVSYCGLYCEDCPNRQGKIADLARDLRKELRQVRFDKQAKGLAKISFFKAFADYPKCYEVLGNMVRLRCHKNCRDGGGNPSCKIRRCCERKKLNGCWECKEFKQCCHYDFLISVHGQANFKNLDKLKKQGIKAFIKGKRFWSLD